MYRQKPTVRWLSRWLYKGRSSDILRNILLKKWDQSDVDPKEFKKIIRTSPNFNHITSIRSFDFSTLYTNIPHQKLKNRFATIIEFLVDNIFVVFGRKVFQQIVGIPMGTNCAPLLADIFLYSYEAEFIQSLLSTGKKIISISVQLHIQIHRWRIVNQ